MALSQRYKELQETTILSQYSASPHILALTEQFARHIDPTDDITLFYDRIFNIDTAQGVGLDIWGRILAMPRTVLGISADWFGYNESQLQPFSQAPFYNPLKATRNYSISDERYRKMLLFKARANISATSAADIADTMTEVLGVAVGVIDNGDMTITIYIPMASISDEEKHTIKTYAKLMTPAGVGVDIRIFNAKDGFGYDGSEMNNFDNGVFDITESDIMLTNKEG